MEESERRSIQTQVAFKGAVDYCVANNVDVATGEGQAQFELVFSYYAESLFGAIAAAQGGGGQQSTADIIHANFPGTVQVPQPQYAQAVGQPATAYAPQQQMFPPQQQGGGIRIKGQQNGPLPDWLFEAAAAKGVSEVYDNRHTLGENPRRPWFKSTSGGPQAPGFWPPDR